MDQPLYRRVRHGLAQLYTQLSTPEIKFRGNSWHQNNHHIMMFDGRKIDKNIMYNNIIEFVHHPLRETIKKLYVMVSGSDITFKGLTTAYVYNKHQKKLIGKEYHVLFTMLSDNDDIEIALHIFDDKNEATDLYNNMILGQPLINRSYNVTHNDVVGVADLIQYDARRRTPMPTPRKPKTPSADWSKRAATAAGGKLT